MSVNLSKNGAALKSAYEEVVSPKSDTNWALFTYEGNSNDLRLAETGGGGLEQLVEELNSGKIMYAFCRVQDPNSGLPKFVLINWTGEGVKDSRKGVCANHLGSIRNFLKGSVYRKVNAVEEIQQTNKDDFWTQNQRDEEERRREENRRAEEERRTREREWREMEDQKARERREMEVRRDREERERRDREERETREREERERGERKWKEESERREREERERREREERQRRERDERERREREERDRAEKLRDVQKIREEEERGENQQQQQSEVENRKSGISTAASVQKANEARSLISQRSFNPREMFLQREKSVEESIGRHAAPSRGKLQSPFLSQKSTAPALAPAGTSPDIYSSPISTAIHQTHLEPTEEPAPAADAEDEWSDEFDDDLYESGGAEWSEGGGTYPAAGSNASDDGQDKWQDDEQDENVYEDFYQTPSRENTTTAADQGPSARALYDYQAADESEITFDPDDIITGIDMVDEGWWRGFGPDGRYGMFPANYVELL
ncbi:drebrin-like protein A isoform X3 [Synchiropus splendidus]|uniref:drebrin-like protein A isoform X3 n=1 Tax=Synchiropus splendidus TaxID=270530 RepID=UPI00237E1690|nr:drebrin-like protein A isoform X3 [Synchiropus splendidus]